MAGQRAGEDRLGDAADRDAQVERVLDGPAAGALLLGLVEHDVDERLAGGRVGVGQHLGGDLDQVGVQAAGVPRAEGLGDLRGLEADAVPEQVVGLGDELHVGVLDAVVHHLDEVAGAVGADVRAARGAVDVRADRLQHRAEGLRTTLAEPPGMIDGPLSAPSSPPDTPMPTKCRPCSLSLASRRRVSWKCALPPSMIMSPGLEQRGELVDHGVGGRTRVDHDDQAAGALEGRDELLGGLGRDEVALVAELLDDVGDAGGSPVVQGDGVTVPGEVAGQVAAHHAEPGDAYLRCSLLCCGHRRQVPSYVVHIWSAGFLWSAGFSRCSLGTDHYATRAFGQSWPVGYAAGVDDGDGETVDWRALNRANWDDRVPIHLASRSTTWPDSGPGRTRCGRSSWVRSVTSPASGWCICSATSGWTRCPGPGAGRWSAGLTSPRPPSRRPRRWRRSWVEAHVRGSDVYDAVAALGGRRFEHRLHRDRGAGLAAGHSAWARVVAGLLAPGGFVYLVEGHPFAQILDDATGLVVSRDYFERGPIGGRVSVQLHRRACAGAHRGGGVPARHRRDDHGADRGRTADRVRARV